MKFYSEKTNKYYDTEKECLSAEKDYEEKLAAEKAKKEELSNARKTRANEVEEAYKQAIDAQNKYRKLLSSFCKDYGNFHMTIKTGEENPFNMFYGLFDRFW